MNMKLYNLFGVGAWEMGCGRGHSVAVGIVDQTILGDWTLLWAYLKQSKIPFLDCLSHILTNGETLRNPTIDCNTACLLVLTECFSCAIYSLWESEWLTSHLESPTAFPLLIHKFLSYTVFPSTVESIIIDRVCFGSKWRCFKTVQQECQNKFNPIVPL